MSKSVPLHAIKLVYGLSTCTEVVMVELRSQEVSVSE